MKPECLALRILRFPVRHAFDRNFLLVIQVYNESHTYIHAPPLSRALSFSLSLSLSLSLSISLYLSLSIYLSLVPRLHLPLQVLTFLGASGTELDDAIAAMGVAFDDGDADPQFPQADGDSEEAEEI